MDFQHDPAIAIPEEIRSFLEGMLLEANLYTNDAAMNEGIVAELFIRFTTYLNSRVLDFIPEEKLADLEKLITSDTSAEAIDAFIAKHIPNYEDVYTKILVEFKEKMLGKTDASDKYIIPIKL